MSTENASSTWVLVQAPEWIACHNLLEAIHGLGMPSILQRTDSALENSQPFPPVALVVLALSPENQDHLQRLHKAKSRFPGAVVISLSHLMSSHRRCELLDAGLDFILENPMSVDECSAFIRSIVRRRNMSLEDCSLPASETRH